MITKIYQTNYLPENGNSLQACVTSIFGLSKWSFVECGGFVPNFLVLQEGYEKGISFWSKSLGFTFQKIQFNTDNKLTETVANGSLCIVRGYSPRGNFGHVVVGRVQDEMIEFIHDPHPENTMLDISKGLVWAGFFKNESLNCFYPCKLDHTKSVCLGDGNIVPWIGFGTYLISNSEVLDSCSYAISRGYNHIDTAEGYNNEESVGLVIKASSHRPFITTKLWPGMNESIKSYDDTIHSFEQSLAKLSVSYIDLYLIHAPFAGKEGRLNQWRALVHLKSLGKIKSIGVSNFSIKHLEEIKEAGLPTPAANQLELHPFCQHCDIISYCRQEGILPIAYSSLAPLSDWRPDGKSGKSTNSVENPLFQSLALKYGVTSSQILLKWGLQHGYPILPKSVHHSRIDKNFDFTFHIDDEDMKSLDECNQNTSFAWPMGDPCDFP